MPIVCRKEIYIENVNLASSFTEEHSTKVSYLNRDRAHRRETKERNGVGAPKKMGKTWFKLSQTIYVFKFTYHLSYILPAHKIDGRAHFSLVWSIKELIRIIVLDNLRMNGNLYTQLGIIIAEYLHAREEDRFQFKPVKYSSLLEHTHTHIQFALNLNLEFNYIYISFLKCIFGFKCF